MHIIVAMGVLAGLSLIIRWLYQIEARDQRIRDHDAEVCAKVKDDERQKRQAEKGTAVCRKSDRLRAAKKRDSVRSYRPN